MKIKIIVECLIAGESQAVGSIVEVSDGLGRTLIEMERAAPVRAEEAKPKAKEAKPDKGGK